MRKATRAVLPLVCLLAAACGDDDGGDDGDDGDDDGVERRIVLFHTNDEHSHLFGFAPEIDDYPLPTEPGDRFHIYNQFVVGVPGRDRVRSFLADHGIGTEVYYPVPFHLQECFAPLGYRLGDFPAAEAAADSTLAIPIYGELTAAQQEMVVRTLADALAS